MSGVLWNLVEVTKRWESLYISVSDSKSLFAVGHSSNV